MRSGDARLRWLYNSERPSRFSALDAGRARTTGPSLPLARGDQSAWISGRHVVFASSRCPAPAYVAATLLDRLVGRQVRVTVAGSRDEATLAEAGRLLSTHDARSVGLPAHLLLDWHGLPDLVVAMGADDLHLNWPGARIRHWPVDEPASRRGETQPLDTLVRQVRALGVDLALNPCCRSAAR